MAERTSARTEPPDRDARAARDDLANARDLAALARDQAAAARDLVVAQDGTPAGDHASRDRAGAAAERMAAAEDRRAAARDREHARALSVSLEQMAERTAALAAAEARLAEAQQVARLGSWEWDIVGGTIEWSDELCRIYGVPPRRRRAFEEFLALVHPDDRGLMESTVHTAYESLQPYSFEHRIVRGDGAVRVLHALGEVIADDAGRPVRMRGTGQDVTERSAADEVRRRLAALVDFSEDAIIGVGLDGVIESWNHGAQTLYGYTAEEAVGQLVAILVPPERAHETAGIRARSRRGEVGEAVETVRLTKDGRRVDVSLRVSPVHDAHGEVVGASSITRRITEQKRLEAQLRSSSRHFEISRDLTVTAGLDGYFKTVNPALEHILGWSPEEFMARPFIDMVHPDDRAATEREFAKLLDGEITFNFVNRYVARDGSYRWLDWNAILDPEEQVLYCAARDVTDRRRVDAALSESERHTRQILETAHDAFVAIDAEGRITDWNPQAQAMFGWPAAEALGRDLAETIVPAEHRDAHRQGLRRFAAGGEIRVVGRLLELPAVDRQGREFPVELTISAVETDHGYSFNAFLRDITDRRRAQEELALARDQALAASKMKSMFVANVSHEIRTPMNGVIGMSDLLLDTTLDDEQREYAEMISSSADALLEVIDDILDFSKIEAGKLELDPTDFDLRDTIEKAVGMQADRAHRKGLELVVAIDPDLPPLLHGDVARLRQVIANFVSNAIKFTATGEVVVRAGATDTAPDSALVRVEVSDTGIGIDHDALAQLFAPFAQADGSTTRKYGGTGLGLAISRQLIELMGGRVDARSEPGQGSSFWFELSLRRAVGPRAAPRDLGGLPVLVVDDHAGNAAVLERQLGSWQAECAVCADAAGALARLESAVAAGRPYAVALVDERMPGVDGYALARAIRAEPSLRGLRLVLLSSSGGRRQASGQSVGFDRLLTKPVRQSRLYEEIRGLVSGEDPAARRAPNPEGAPAGPARGLEVLVVEDTAVNQAVAVRMLAKSGFRARVAENGLRALEALAERSYAAVLMDCQMPELDGYETTREIRRRDADGQRIPIIAMTGNSMRGERERCLAAGMDDYLTKPLRNQTLREALERLVSPPTAVTAPGDPTVVAELDFDLVDPAVLAELDFDPAGLTALLGLYFTGAERHVDELADAVTRGEVPVVAQTAHKLKGSSGTIGATRVAHLAAELEGAAGDDDLAGAPRMLERLRRALVETRAALAPAD